MIEIDDKTLSAITSDVYFLAQEVFNLPEIALGDSSLLRDMKVEIRQENDSIIIDTLFDGYIIYVEHGRQPQQGKQPPIDALRDWALSKGIATDNSTLYAISRSIWEHGMAPKPILAILKEMIDKRYKEVWEKQIAESIIANILQNIN